MSTRITLPLAHDHPAFAGHFPGRPIVPGALLIDLAVQAVETATRRQVTAIAQAKFLSPAVPHELLALSFKVSDATVAFDIETGDGAGARKLASGRLTLAPQAA